MANRRSTLALLAAGLGGAAVAGFGLSVGRDVYKSTKKGAGLILIVAAALGAILLPMLGARELVRGHDRGPFGTAFITIIGSFALIAIGFVLGLVLLSIVMSDKTDPQKAQAAAIVSAMGATGVFSLIGLLWGAAQRGVRLRTFEIAKANERFLTSIGFQETGGDDITHYDQDGQALRLLESHGNRLVFMAVGRRGKRAFIDLAPDGKMLSYSGVI